MEKPLKFNSELFDLDDWVNSPPKQQADVIRAMMWKINQIIDYLK